MLIDNVAIIPSGGALPTDERTIKTGETFQAGDFCTLNLDGTVSEATASSAHLYGRIIKNFFEDKVTIVLALPDVQFAINATATAAAAIGKLVDLSVNGTTGDHEANIAGTSTSVFQVRDIIPHVVNAANTKILVSVPAAKSQAVTIGGDS